MAKRPGRIFTHIGRILLHFLFGNRPIPNTLTGILDPEDNILALLAASSGSRPPWMTDVGPGDRESSGWAAPHV